MTKHLLAFFVLFPVFTFSQLWQNDFSSPADWISTDLNSGTDTWIIASSAIGGPVDTINSLSAGNGFAQFNSEAQCSASHQDITLMYDQTIDISSFELSYLEIIQHYKRKSDSVYVEFSNDGLSWQSIRINEQYWFYQQTSNPDTVKISIPESVQAAPFWMRFRFSGECGYAWLMDDLKIYEKHQYACNSETSILINGRNYQQANHCVIDTLDYGVTLSNLGYDTLHEVIIEYAIYENGSLQTIQKDTVVTLLPMQEIDTIFYAILFSDGTPPVDYQVDSKIYSDDLDTIWRSNLLDGTNHALRKDQGSIQGAFLTSADVWGVGQTFIATEEYCSKKTTVFIPTAMPDGSLAYLVWYRLVNGQWVQHGFSDDVTLNSTTSGYWANFYSSFNDVYYEGDTGLVVFGSYGDELPVAYAQRSYENDIYLLDQNSDLIHAPDGHALLIELQTNYLYRCNCFLDLDENKQDLLMVSPNPASTQIQIQNVTGPIQVVKIFSLEGREVYSDFEPESEYVPVSHLEPGTYFILVESVNGVFYSGRFIRI